MIASSLGKVRGRDAWEVILEYWPSDIPPPSSVTEWIASMLTASYIQKVIEPNSSSIAVPISEAGVCSSVMVGLDYTAIPSNELEVIAEYEQEFSKITYTRVEATASSGASTGFTLSYSLESPITLSLPIVIYGVLKGSQKLVAPRVSSTFPALLTKSGGELISNIAYAQRGTATNYIVEEVITLEDNTTYRALATSDSDVTHPKDVDGGFKVDGSDGVIPVAGTISWGMLGAALAENKSLVFEGAVFSPEYTWEFAAGATVTMQVSRPTALPAAFKVSFNGPWSSFINTVSGPVIPSTNELPGVNFLSVTGWVTYNSNNPNEGAFIYIQTTASGRLLIKTRYSNSVSGTATGQQYMWQ